MATNIYTKIMQLRQDICNAGITKTGHNPFHHSSYVQLEDFIPKTVELCNKYQLYTHTNIGVEGYATLTVVNIENTEETLTYKLKVPELPTTEFKLKREVSLSATNRIQDMGKLESYVRRYLYMLFLDLAVPDDVENGNTNSKPKKTLKQMNQEKQAKKEENESTEYETQTVEPRHRPRPLNTDLQIEDPEPIKTITIKLTKMLEEEGKEISKSNMRVKASQCHKEKKLITSPLTLKNVVDYINKNCPEEESENG